MDRVSGLLDQAQAATSLDDFGDESFREGLGRLVASADAEARFNDAGHAMFDAQIVSFLSSRLRIEHWYRLHPEIDEEEIVAPLIGLGLPRTGSTALSCMLAQDPAVRFIRNWEGTDPCPPPETATQHDDPRIALAEARMKQRDAMFPRMKQMVPSTATTPTECQTFMGFDFKSQLFQAMARIPSYVAWFNHEADLAPTYLYVKRVLKLLQWRCPPDRWRLKNPTHILFVDALNQVFPDARFWMTHRDVADVIPSVADLYFELSRPFTDSIDKAWLGEVTADFCEIGMKRVIAFRAAGNDDRFFDVDFAPFMQDPYPTLEDLYAFLGEMLTPETRARIAAWRLEAARDKHGRHLYDPADFGLDPHRLRDRFAFYSRRFGLSSAPV
ncbi:sulfotransferase [Sphingomonas oligophenolica]|uniref:Sulfotransferase n=1 Tax=Sphingomonas oligophenolica TaxID=301154 RepID=A0ABU9Y261_9SPHN